MVMSPFIARRLLLAALLLAPAFAAASGTAGPPAPQGKGALYGDLLAGSYAATTGNERDAARYDIEALGLDPDNRLLLRRAFIEAMLTENPEAQALADRLPQDPLAAMIRGNQALGRQDFREAETDYASIPPQGVTGLLRPLLIAWAEFGAGETDDAIQRLTPLAGAAPFGGVYALNAALIADLAARVPVASALYRQVRADFPVPNLRVGQALASWEARQGMEAKGDAILIAMTEAHPDLRLALPAFRKDMAKPLLRSARDGVAEAYLTLAGSLNQPDQMLLQQGLLRFALRLRPDLAAARLLLAETEAEQAKPREAVATIQAVAPDQPLFIPAALRAVPLLNGLHETDRAIALLKTVSAMAPDAIAPLEMQADLLRDSHHDHAAKTVYTEALAKFGINTPPRAWSLYYGRAIAEDQLGEWPAALADLKEAGALAPDQPYLLNYLAYSYAVHGVHLKQAETMVEQALQAVPDDGGIIDSLGYILLKRGKIAEAMQVQIKAVQLTPDEPVANAHLGDIFMASGNRLAALYQWERALTLKPDPPLRKQIEASIQGDDIPPVQF